MKTDILIISDALIEPPTDSLAFRTVTMFCHEDFSMNVLIHTTQEMKDLYYHYMVRKGIFDYIDYILNEWEYESGVRLDVISIYPRCIKVKYIIFENQMNILNQIKSLSKK